MSRFLDVCRGFEYPSNARKRERRMGCTKRVGVLVHPLRNGQLYSVAAQLQRLMPTRWRYSSSTCSIRPSLARHSSIPRTTLRSLQHAEQFRPQYGPPSKRCSIQTRKAACHRRRCSMSAWRRVSERMVAFSERTDFTRYAKAWGISG